MLSPWRKFRAHLAVEIAQLLGVPVTVDVEFQFPELRKPRVRGLFLPKAAPPPKILPLPSRGQAPRQ